ncbi:MAG TPA: Fic family protein [Ignavibacteria bacterium]|nr:Fic family protein [Ignavibacteria bacterium]
MNSFEYDYFLDQPISQKILIAVRTLGEYKGKEILYKEQFPEVLKTLQQASIIQSTESSNRIEGIIVPENRIRMIVAQKAKPQNRPEEEVAGYKDILNEIHTNFGRHNLSPKLILKWIKDLYKYTPEKVTGFKTEDNAILEILPSGKTVVRFRPLSAQETPSAVSKLCTMYNKNIKDKKIEPLLAVASFVLDFECIHPFKDGNGRIGRLLTLLLLYQVGYEVGRFISLERITEESKEAYYDALYKSSQNWNKGEHDLIPWWDYFLSMLIAAYKEFEERVGYITTAKGAKRELVFAAIDKLPDEFSFSDVQRACPGVSFSTIKRALQELKAKKIIKSTGKGRDAKYRK